jgi:tricorn protease-like protein
MALIREDHGRGRIVVRDLGGRKGADEAVTPPELNVLEASFLTADGSGGLVFSAASKSGPSLFTVDESGNVKPLDSVEARYPAVSPDGRWLAYSKLQKGSWNLEIRDLTNGQSREVTNAACNATEPAWAADSKTLLYASDCGRALWFTVICKRRVIP